ncbi:MAG: succinyl-diaminopimelate desuccinylase [Gammaproteobacteria bacterium]|nr:succinyl-diaminopimelate desuccinylase [Gammaproteobacteria bacterium]
MSDTIEFARELIRRASVTPADEGCQALMLDKLHAAGFEIEHMAFTEEGYDQVLNFWAYHGNGEQTLCFAGHTDVVPPGPLESWERDPYDPVIEDGVLYGRGSADMKGALAAMVNAAVGFVEECPDHTGRLAFLITSDEEGRARAGTKMCVEKLTARGEKIDWCVIGEPSSTTLLGDAIKVGRRGSLSGMLTVHGVQGHVAYPHLADNPIESFAPVLAEIYATPLDDGNEFFPPTSFQVVQLESGTGFPNVTPGSLFTRFNFRYSTVWSHTQLKTHIENILDKHAINYTLEWHLSGEPFITEGGELVAAVQAAVKANTGIDPELSTSGGTSDGRFISPAGAQVVEFGVSNATIHKPNECMQVADIEIMEKTYKDIMLQMLG